MVELRHALRAYADRGLRPAEILTRCWSGPCCARSHAHEFATLCLVLMIERGPPAPADRQRRDTCRRCWSNPERAFSYLEVARPDARPVAAPTDRTPVVDAVPGDPWSIVMITDGLIE